uniref:F0F1 ATP synthase subunit B n=1 Tax=Vaginimicrobium propionicum TaxID=1871034 RepID=UPI000970F33A|nr:F0F1 ATP synthase subunit B [Vaginimicrobium propionicum]
MTGFGLIPLEGTFGPLAPEHWSEVVVGFVLAVLIAFGVQKFVVPKFETMYAERSNEIEGGIRRSEQAQLEAKASKAEYQALLDRARGDSVAAREKAKEQAAAIVAEARDQAQHEAERMIAQARAQIESERAEAFSQLQKEVGGLATTLAGRIIGEELSNSEAASRTVDRFLTELESK